MIAIAAIMVRQGLVKPTLGILMGKVVGAQGRPYPGAQILVLDAKGRVSEARTDDKGQYRLGLKPGSHRIFAAYVTQFVNGRKYRLPLDLAGGGPLGFDAKVSRVADFTFRTSGRIDPKRPSDDEKNCFGGTVEIRMRDDIREKFSGWLVVTMRPTMTFDAGFGKTLTFTRKMGKRRADRFITDVPLGEYEVKVVFRDRNGNLSPVRVAATEKGPSARRPEPGPTTILTFAPHEGITPLRTTSGVVGANLYVGEP